MKTGIFCISIDTELLWGRKDQNYQKFISRTKKERQIIKNILALFDKYEIPATWAITTKLLEKDKNHEGELWYGKDIYNLIKDQKEQEIGSHSYTHPEFTSLTQEQADIEIKNSKAKSFVYPRNKIKYLPLLKKYGFTSYRGKDLRRWELLYPGIPAVHKPYKKNRLINIPGSLYFVSARGIRKYIPKGLRFFKAKLGIDSAIKQKRVFHLWFHPVDFADNSSLLLDEFENILKYAYKKRLQGVLEIKNMYQITKSL